MSKKRPALGRGLGALIPEKTHIAADSTAKPAARRDGIPRELPIEAVIPNPDQPRKRFAPEHLEALSASIRSQGIIQPIVVTPLADASSEGRKRYQIIAGERRWRAAQIAGLLDVPVFIRDTPEHERLELALVENLQRANLDPMEEAHAYEQLLEQHNYTQEQLALRVGKERSTVANAMRLLKLPEKVRDMVAESTLGMGHARALLALKDPSEILRLAHEVIQKNMSVRATEKSVRRLSHPPESSSEQADEDDDARRHKTIVADLESRLQRQMGARVRLKTSKKGRNGPGKIEVPYNDLDDLNRILHMLLGTGDRST